MTDRFLTESEKNRLRPSARAVLGVESSGGNASAIGPWVDGHRAYGFSQVMDYNIPDWTLKHYGRRLTPAEYLTNIEAQIAVTNGEFLAREKRYGDIRRVAASWFGGPGNAENFDSQTISDGHTSMREYTTRVERDYLKLTGTSKYSEWGGSSFNATNANSASYSYIWPAKGETTSEYGPRGSRMHRGVDIAVPSGTEVYAARDGKVDYVGFDAGGYGNWIIVVHPDGHETRYGHLSSFKARVGQEVKQGEVIALSGNTGRSTGPHLHFEIRTRSGAVDPRNYLPTSQSWRPSSKSELVPNFAAVYGAVTGPLFKDKIVPIIKDRLGNADLVRRAKDIGSEIIKNPTKYGALIRRAKEAATLLGIELVIAIGLVLLGASPVADAEIPDDKKRKEEEDKDETRRESSADAGIYYFPKGRLFK